MVNEKGIPSWLFELELLIVTKIFSSLVKKINIGNYSNYLILFKFELFETIRIQIIGNYSNLNYSKLFELFETIQIIRNYSTYSISNYSNLNYLIFELFNFKFLIFLSILFSLTTQEKIFSCAATCWVRCQ